MGKAKPVKKVAQSPLKISTSLFQRKSKTSQGAGQIEKREAASAAASSKKSAKGSTSTSTPTPKKGKQGKSNEASSSSGGKSPSKSAKGGKDVSPSTGWSKKPVGKTQKASTGNKKGSEKRPPSPAPEPKSEKKGKATKASTKKGKAVSGKVAKAPVKAVIKKKKVISKKLLTSSSSSSSASSVTSSDGERERSTRSSVSNSRKVPEKTRKSRESREDKSPSPSSRLRSPDSEKVTTRKRSKSDSESPPPQKMAKVGEKGKGKNAGKKFLAQKKLKGKAAASTTTTSKDVAKKVSKKAVASIVASKKKTVVKKVKKSARVTSSSSASSTTSSSSSSKAKDSSSPAKKKPVKTAKPVKKAGKVVKMTKPKAKPRTKIKLKRMASLNAKAILEASFSFEPSEKRRSSPAPSSSSTPQKSKSAGTSMEDSAKGTIASLQDVKPSMSSSGTSTSSPSSAKGVGSGESKMKDAAVSVSVSTATSPTPPEMPESPKTFKKNPVPVKGEKKRKSTDASSSTGAGSGSRRESTSSTKSSSKDVQTSNFSSQHNHASVGTSTQTSTTPAPVKKEKSTGKAGSRRSSAAGSVANAATGTATATMDASTIPSPVSGKGIKEKSGKKKQKMVAAATTTSTSTSTSPIPMWNEDCDVVVEKRGSVASTATGTSAAPTPKQKKQRSGSSGGREKGQDSSSQVQQGQMSHHHHHHSMSSSSSSKHHKSASYQTKEKSSTPVAVYGSGTVYQPAGPLIEPHKQSSSVPAGILPETVRLPPDLKVTYQTHPPSSAFMASPTETRQQQQQQQHHHHHHSTKASGGSSKSQKSSSSKSEKSSGSSAGTILHQPYKSTPSSSSSPALSRNVPSSYSSTGSGYASSTGTPLLSPSDVISHQHQHHQPGSSASAAAGGGSMHGSQSGSSSIAMSAHHHPLHSVTPGGSISVGGGSSQTSNPGAPSSSGLFYATTNYGPHHSPYASCKYPIVPPETYRTQSPFPNSFLCPPSTPQPPSQPSYFMTPFYTPPLTPNSTPGLGTVGPNHQGRPLSLSSAAAMHHHPAAAAAAAAAYYQQQSGPLSQPPPPGPSAAAHLPASYYMASPQHHSIHPTPAPGHAGPFRPNQSSQPACPCPTESCPPSSNSTSSRPPPLQQRPSLSSGLQAPEAGAKQPKRQSSTSPALVSVTASRPSRKDGAHPPHPPTCRTPAVGADPPSAIQIIPSGDAQNRQQLESAKTFTEQYSLPDDITITPILPPPSQNAGSTNPALLMLNSSVSVILTSAPSKTTTTMTSTTSKSSTNHPHHHHQNHQDGLLKLNNSSNTLPSKPKEKDIVHVIDPRSGQRTTIAKHISNNSRFAGISDSNKKKAQSTLHQEQVAARHITGSMTVIGLGNSKSSNSRIAPNKSPNSRMETVRKLNPDLDVIVINRGELQRSDKIENIQGNMTSPPPATKLPEKHQLPSRAQMNQGQMLKQMPPLKQAGGRLANNKMHGAVPFSAISSSVMGISPQVGQQGKRQALAHNGNNNFHRNGGGPPGSLLKVNQRRGKNAGALAGNKSIQQGNSYPSSTSTSASTTAFQMNYTMPVLPPGISISAGSGGVGGSDMQPTNLSKKVYNNSIDFQPVPNRFHQVNQGPPYGTQQKQVKAIKRSLNECIDGLQLQHQQKKLKMLEQQHTNSGSGRVNVFGNGSPNTSARTAIYNVNGGKSVFTGGRGTSSVSPQQFHQQSFFNSNKCRLSLPTQFPLVFNRETTTAARVRDPDYEMRLGGMLINSSDAVNAVSALVVDQQPRDYSMARARQMGMANAQHRHPINTNGLSSRGMGMGRGRGRGTSARHSALGSYAFAEAKKKVTKLKQMQQERVSGRGGGAGGGSSSAKSKIRTRLSVKPKGLHGNSQQPLGSRSRSRLLRKRSLLCNPNNAAAGGPGGNRRSESDSSICASRSSSSVRIISGAQNGSKPGRDRDRERPRNTQAFINATADLYQYRRSVILRVPSPKPLHLLSSADGEEPTAVSNLNRSVTADQIARFGDVSPSSSSSSVMVGLSEVQTGGNNTVEIHRELAAHQMAQLARTHILMNNTPVSLSPQAQQESKGPVGSSTSSSSLLPRTGSMVVNALKKRAGMKPLSPASVNGALNQQLLLSSKRQQPRWSNGWRFEGEPYEAKVYVKNDDSPITRRCYPSMRHDGGDVIRTRDCVLLKSGPRKNDLPFIAKIAALWENPTDGEMMFSLLWYYRPEHTELGRTKDDMMDEIFASKHRDTNSVATIEDRCYVLTFNEYCRYRKRLKELEQGIPDSISVPFADTAMINTNTAAKIAEAVWNGISVDPSKRGMTSGKVSPEVVFFCRKVYDFRQKRILKNPS